MAGWPPRKAEQPRDGGVWRGLGVGWEENVVGTFIQAEPSDCRGAHIRLDCFSVSLTTVAGKKARLTVSFQAALSGLLLLQSWKLALPCRDRPGVPGGYQ